MTEEGPGPGVDKSPWIPTSRPSSPPKAAARSPVLGSTAPPLPPPPQGSTTPVASGPLLAAPASPPVPGPPIGDPLAFPGPPAGFAPERSRLWTLVAAAGLGALVAALVTGGLLLSFRPADRIETIREVSAPRRVDPLSTGESMDIQAVLERVRVSVVSIEVGSLGQNGLFGQGAGSGVIISDDGLVLTNAHVVEGGTDLSVVLFDGSARAADLVNSLPEEDLALIRVRDVDSLIPATLGRSGDLRVGDPVLAIGNALNLGGKPSVTLGIVSARDRSIQAPGISLANLIQTDAAINPGNSGGALVNADGEVVGINTAIIEDAQNIGFAIAIDPVKPILDDLRAGEAPEIAFFGVSTISLEEITPETIEQFEITVEAGSFVAEVVPGSAADDMGLEAGDVLVEVDGESASTPSEVAGLIRQHDPGDEIIVVWEHEGQTNRRSVELGSRLDN
ncbi:MAG: trypsin-like serine protease [Actinomycetia bacterium]|nr:trypsin-like serine protease [Actinomycetes bacterium]